MRRNLRHVSTSHHIMLAFRCLYGGPGLHQVMMQRVLMGVCVPCRCCRWWVVLGAHSLTMRVLQ